MHTLRLQINYDSGDVCGLLYSDSVSLLSTTRE